VVIFFSSSLWVGGRLGGSGLLCGKVVGILWGWGVGNRGGNIYIIKYIITFVTKKKEKRKKIII